MNEARATLVLALLVGGIVGGVALQRVTEAGARENPYPSLQRVAEPAVSAEVAAAIANGDPKALSRLVDGEVLAQLREALMSPTGEAIADIRSVKFVGATAKDRLVLAGYIVTGKDIQGLDAIVGFVLDIENGQIVGVN